MSPEKQRMMRSLTMVLVVCAAGVSFAQRPPAAQPPPATQRAATTQPARPAPLPPISELNLSGNEVRVETTESGHLILTGSEEDVAKLEAFIAALDSEVFAPELRVVTVEKRPATEIAQSVQKALTDSVPPALRERPEKKVTLTAVSNNVLLIAAAPERMQQVIDIINAIEAVEPSIPDFTDLTIQLKHTKPSEAVNQLKAAIDAIRKQQGEAATGPQIQYMTNDATGELKIIGVSEDERAKIEPLIAFIDAEPVEGFGNLKVVVYPLLNADADAMVEVINTIVSSAKTTATGAGAGGGAGGGAQSQISAAQEVIRRLSIAKMGPDGEIGPELPPLDLSKPFKVIPDKQSNSLMVAMAEKNVEPMSELIQLLDTVPISVEMGLQIFPLRFADAETLETTIRDFFEAGKKLPQAAPGGEATKAVPEGTIGEALVYEIAVKADTRTNTLVVAGRPKQTAMVAAIVRELDVSSPGGKFPLRLLFLGKNVDATRVGAIITELFEKRLEALEAQKAGPGALERERVFLAVDVQSNALIISASEPNFAEISEIAGKLDVPGERLIDSIRIINLKNTSAADLQTKIEDLWQRKAELKGADSNAPKDLPILVADQRSNSLVIASSPEDFAEIERLVAKLEAQPLAPLAQIQLLPLKQNDATDLADKLKTLFEERAQQRLAEGQSESPSDKVAIVADESTNTLLIAASRENFEEMTRIVTALDVAPEMEGFVELFSIKHAVATDLADRINELFDKEIYTPGLSTGELADKRRKVAVIAEPRSNMVIASGSPANLSLIRKLIAEMDKTDTYLPGETQIIALQFADAVKVADTLDKLFEGLTQNLPEGSDYAKPTIIADQRSNSLIIAGSADALIKTRGLVDQLDRKPGERFSFEIYALQHGSAVRLAPKIQDMFDERAEGTDDKSTPVNIVADEGSNSLVATASPEDHAVIRGLLDLLDKPSNIAKQVEIFPLKYAKAEQLSDRLEQLFQTQGQGQAAAGRADAIAVQPDERANALIVWAATADMENIREIIEKLDTTKPAAEQQVRVIQLKQALAEDLAKALTEVINGEGGGQGQDQQAIIMTFKERLEDGSEVERQLLRQDISITPYKESNSLLVKGPKDSMDMLENLIRYVDRQPPTVAEIRLFPLVNADAEEVVERLTDLFEQQQSSSQSEMERRLIFEGGAAPAAPAGPVGAAGEGGGVRQQLRFTADRRTNTVVAAGSTVDLRMVEELIRQLDAPDAVERVQFVYQAKYGTAEDIGNAISEFNDQERERYQDLDDATAKMRVAERLITAVTDESSNSVIIGASPRYFDQYMNMIRKIDRPPPQVMIQVLIAEVTLNDRIELGMEFAAQDLQFTERAFIGPNGTVQGPNNFDFAGGTSLGAAGTGGGFSFSVTGEGFSFLLRALQTDGRAEVLSRPVVMVQDNETGNITIGDRVPFVRNATVSDTGQLQSQVEYEDVGIKLDVTPHINPDGYVNLEIAPEISALAASTVPITEGLNAPTFTNRSAETTVTVKDGETIIIGGLITSSVIHRETKVPVLGDIPGLGLLFRTNIDDRERRELLVVLTVKVLWDEADALRASLEQRDKSGIIPEKVKRDPLFEGLRIRAEEEPSLSPVPRSEPPIRSEPVRPPSYGPTPGVYGPTRRTTATDMPRDDRKLTAAGYGPRVGRAATNTEQRKP